MRTLTGQGARITSSPERQLSAEGQSQLGRIRYPHTRNRPLSGPNSSGPRSWALTNNSVEKGIVAIPKHLVNLAK